jgi:hypothetical protein
MMRFGLNECVVEEERKKKNERKKAVKSPETEREK